MNGHNGLPGRDGREGAKGERGMVGPRGLKGEVGQNRKVSDPKNWKQCVWKSADGRDIGLIKV